MKKFTEIFKIKQMKFTAFHPQKMSAIKRSHHSLIEYLRHFATGDDWDQWLLYAIFSYKTSVHSATRLTPHEIIFGKKARIPSEFSSGKIKSTYHDYVDELLNKLVDTQKLVAVRLETAKQKSKAYYDQKLKIVDFKVGQHVFLLNEPRKDKLDDHYNGPYKIVKVFDNRNCVLDVGNKNFRVVHLDKLKHAYYNYSDDE